MKTDHELVAHPQGRGAEIAARSHHLPEDLLFCIPLRIEVRKRLSLGHRDSRRIVQLFPRRRAVYPHRAGVNHLADRDLCLRKNLLRIPARGSALAQIGPIDFHRLLLFVLCIAQGISVLP